MNTKIRVISRKLLADLQTPVSIYLKVRDMSPQSALLESSDYHSADNSFSFIGIEPVASFSVVNGNVAMQYPCGHIVESSLAERSLQLQLNDFVKSFDIAGDNNSANGFFGYTAYDTVKYLENINIESSPDSLPEVKYILYRFVIAINHLRNEMSITENLTEGQQSRKPGNCDCR